MSKQKGSENNKTGSIKKAFGKALAMSFLIGCCVFLNSSERYLPSADTGISFNVSFDDSKYVKTLPVRLSFPQKEKIKNVKYAYARVAQITYFTKYNKNGTVIKQNEHGEYCFDITQNGYVSVFVEYQNGITGLRVVKINNIDAETPTLTIDSRTIPESDFTVVDVKSVDNCSRPIEIRYVPGAFASVSDEIWNSAPVYSNEASFVLNKGKYTFLAMDEAGNYTISIRRFGQFEPEEEFRAVWICYYDFKSSGYASEKAFREHIGTMFNEAVTMNMNAVVVHVRPYSDAMYPSKYYPWSKYCSGKQGKNPGFDPLKIMVEEAHARGLEFHAWLNPYRVTNSSTDPNTLSADHPARIYMTDNNPNNDRNVIAFDGKLYFNPSKPDVQQLIINGIKEIVENYDVDGIHFDDYFYPSLGNDYANNFDAQEYKEYKQQCINEKKNYLSIDNWRRNNVNTLVKNIYAAVKEINPNVVYGISPGGFIDSLRDVNRYYVDFETWLGHDGYIDYLCPQIYWSNDNKYYPYDKTLSRWLSFPRNPDVKFYVGVGAYKAGITTEGYDWQSNPDVLKNMIIKGRQLNVDGFVIFDYKNLISKRNTDFMINLLKELNPDKKE